MVNYTSTTALLCIFSWISVSLSEFHTVEVQPGEDVTLLCSNFSSVPSHIVWFRLTNRPNVSRISFMLSSDGNVTFCDGFKNGRFDATSNTTTLFLKIKQVNFTDSGLYFCGFYSDGNSVIVSATSLKVQEVFVGITSLTSVILGALSIFLLIVVIGLVVTIRKLHTAHEEKQNLQHSEPCEMTDNLNYAALSFRPKVKSSRRPASEYQLCTSCVYTATR